MLGSERDGFVLFAAEFLARGGQFDPRGGEQVAVTFGNDGMSQSIRNAA